ncbi:MAG TPA: hypothetical protein PKJ62_05345 [Bacteroidia bacterium]|nr:hypothetical protein [Bacteroidia bacterium]HNS13028.1 hypothetical protein [Bacteroidia bacterium]
MPKTLLISLIFISNIAIAQGTLLFCDKVDAQGNPVNTFESLILSPEGQTIHLLYHSDSGPLSTAEVKLEIAQLVGHSFKRTDLKSIFTDPTKELISIPYTLKTQGDYRFKLMNREGKVLAEEILSVSVEMTEAGMDRESKGNSTDPELPPLSEIQFSDPLMNNYNTEFSFRTTKGKLRLTLEPFDENDPDRILDLWQKENEDYKVFIRSEKATFRKEGMVGIYELSFPAPNEYKVDVHTSDNRLITSGFVGFK